MAILMNKMGKFEKALEIFNILLESTLSDHNDTGHLVRASVIQNIGNTHQSMGNYAMALSHFEKAHEIFHNSIASNHPVLATNYNNIAEVHQSMGNYAMALSHLEKALEICQKSLPSNHPNLALNYNNIAAIYQSMDNFSMALS